VGKVAKRAFLNGGGGLLTITNDENQIDGTAIGAAVIRVITVILFGLAVYFLDAIGLPGAEIIEAGTQAVEGGAP
jgi:hypothetical protein